jgi:hypothetical protein
MCVCNVCVCTAHFCLQSTCNFLDIPFGDAFNVSISISVCISLVSLSLSLYVCVCVCVYEYICAHTQVQTRWDVQSVDGGNACTITIRTQVEFVKSNMFKGKITSETVKDLKELYGRESCMIYVCVCVCKGKITSETAKDLKELYGRESCIICVCVCGCMDDVTHV